MPKSLAKVQKKISKKKGSTNSLHENSRDSQRLRRAGARDDKLARVAAARAKTNQPHLQRVSFFQQVAQQATGPMALDTIQGLIQRYLQRSDEELATLKQERRPGRPSSTREDLLKQRIVMEGREYDTGFWIPDLEDEENLKQLEKWNGEWSSLNTLKYIRQARSGSRHDSSFPPKGQS
ncbi:MAG: hypothetical protein M1812_000991 [Candelaria pacifica]|nr:MAG: hypothetical protein M1812_000991 [Candelaria pacifica]